MKKRITIFYIAIAAFFQMIIVPVKIYALNYTISFTGTGATTSVESVVVQNLTKGTVLTVPNGNVLILSDIANSIEKQNENTTGISIYPNPIQEKSTVTFFSKQAGSTQISVFSLGGKKIIGSNNFFPQGKNSFQLSIPNGDYLLQVQGSGFTYNSKLISRLNSETKSQIIFTRNENQSLIKPQKSNSASTTMLYNTGDQLLYKGISGNYSTIVTDKPTESKTTNFEFVECKDVDNNYYSVVKIGEQTWMAENLKSTCLQNGDSLKVFPVGVNWSSTIQGAVCSYNSDETNAGVFGRLYNWYALNDSRNLSPVGWHVASDVEWTILTNFLTDNNFGFGGSGSDIGKSVSATMHWNSNTGLGNVGFETEMNNSAGLALLPGGGRLTNGVFSGIKNHAVYWTATQNNTTDSWVRYVSFGGDEVYKSNSYKKHFGLSVRCIRDRLATVSTSKASAITTISATSGGVISDDGGVPLISCGICYDTVPVHDFQKNKIYADTILGKEFICKINKLIDYKRYFVRAFTVNREGESWGDEISFTTLVASKPIIITDEITSITSSGAVCGGSIISDGGTPILASGICWSETNNPTINEFHTVEHHDSTTFECYIENLKPGKAYFVRSFATNIKGTSYGSSLAMATLTTLPVVTGVQPSMISSALISCSGNVVSDGGTVLIDKGVCWSNTDEPTLQNEYKSAGNQTGKYYLLISGLTPDRDYYFRSYAQNSHGTVYGRTFKFKTSPTSPSVKTGNMTIIGSSSVTASGEILSGNGGQIIQKGICWSTRPQPDLTDTFLVSNSDLNPFYSIIFGLEIGKIYYLRAFATNQYGTSYGNEIYLQAVKPLVNTSEISNICPEKIRCGGNVMFDGGSSIIQRGLCWSENPDPSIEDSLLITGNSTGNFAEWVRGLKSETRYYVRAFATNQVGTTYGNAQMFDTPKKFYPEPVMYNLNMMMRKFDIPGAQFAIFRKGKLVYQKSLGLSDKENNINVNNEDLFRIASVSKPITALAILNLFHKNQLKPDDIVFGNEGILGNEYGFVHPDSAKSKITIKHLLDHKSGWVNKPNDPMFSDSSQSQTQIIADMLLNRPLEYQPGTEEKYSNFGYCLLGRVIEKVSGLKYADYVQNNILTPCKISNMMIGGNSESERLPKEVKYYQTEYSPYKMNITRMDSHGGWVATATDLAHLLVHFDKDLSVPDLLPDTILDKMYFGNSWGWGFYGSLPGTTSIVYVNQSTDIGYVFIGNTRKENDCNKETDPACVTMHDEISSAIRSRFYSITDWPEYDLFE